MSKTPRKPLVQSLFLLLFALFFGLAATCDTLVVFSGDIKAKIAENYMRSIRPKDFLFWAAASFVAFFVMMAADRLLDRLVLRRISGQSTKKKLSFAALAAAVLAVCWLPYLLALAPGNLLEDSTDSIHQMLAHGHPTSNHHPMFYTLAVGVFLKLGNVLFHSSNAGVLCFTLFQYAAMIVCVVCLLAYMCCRGVPRPIVGLALLYYAAAPFFPTYAVTMWKDIPYSCALLLISILLAEIARNRLFRGGQAALALLYLAAMMSRNNGLYVICALIPCSCLLCRKHWRSMLVSGICAVILFLALSMLAIRFWHIEEDFAESVGIPLQQIGYTLSEGGTFSPEDLAYLFRLCPQDVWRYAYRPCLNDPLKWNPQFDALFLCETKGQFFGVWLRTVLANPLLCLRAHLLATYGFWSPKAIHDWGYMYIEIHKNSSGIQYMNLLESLFGISLRPFISALPPLVGSGTLLWLSLAGFTLCMKQKQSILPYLPALINSLTVFIATPAAFSLRYVYILALGLPLFLTLPVIESDPGSPANRKKDA